MKFIQPLHARFLMLVAQTEEQPILAITPEEGVDAANTRVSQHREKLLSPDATPP
jgi:hypothetical protein